MMSMSFSPETSHSPLTPINCLLYRDVAAPLSVAAQTKKGAEVGSEKNAEQPLSSGPSVKEVEEIVEAARSQARIETEGRLKAQYEMKGKEAAASVREALELFVEERKDYFGRVESEVVHLALAISAKILHRESQVDPTLVSALVRVAIEKLHDSSGVSVRVPSQEAEKWRGYMENPLNGTKIKVVEDNHLGPLDAILETNLGSANFNVDAQLKEVEQGFFDLLAQRPDTK
jgi:flagellar assembly protein FliH